MITTADMTVPDIPATIDGNGTVGKAVVKDIPAPSSAPPSSEPFPGSHTPDATELRETRTHTIDQSLQSDTDTLSGIHDRNVLEQLAELQRKELVRIEVEELSIAMRRASVARSLEQVLQRLQQLPRASS